MNPASLIWAYSLLLVSIAAVAMTRWVTSPAVSSSLTAWLPLSRSNKLFAETLALMAAAEAARSGTGFVGKIADAGFRHESSTGHN